MSIDSEISTRVEFSGSIKELRTLSIIELMATEPKLISDYILLQTYHYLAKILIFPTEMKRRKLKISQKKLHLNFGAKMAQMT